MSGQKNELPRKFQGAFRELGMLLPVVETVHGAAHPELLEIGRLCAELKQQLEANAPKATTTALTDRLRALTNQYTVPSDACVAFRKTYAALGEIAGQID